MANEGVQLFIVEGRGVSENGGKGVRSWTKVKRRKHKGLVKKGERGRLDLRGSGQKVKKSLREFSEES